MTWNDLVVVVPFCRVFTGPDPGSKVLTLVLTERKLFGIGNRAVIGNGYRVGPPENAT